MHLINTASVLVWGNREAPQNVDHKKKGFSMETDRNNEYTANTFALELTFFVSLIHTNVTQGNSFYLS
jgi:hypothetical protein